MPSLILSLLVALAGGPARTPEQVTNDWIRQEQVRWTGVSFVTTVEDAAGAVDGQRTGKWGFHTQIEDQPWWQVDLGAATPISRIEVYNRADGAEGRAAWLMLLASDDGAEWRVVYRHDGSVFRGAPDGKPLVVRPEGLTARYVRAQLPAREYLHLDEVEVYAESEGGDNLALGKPADQCSISQWSTTHAPGDQAVDWVGATRRALDQAREQARRLEALGVPCEAPLPLDRLLAGLGATPEPAEAKALFLEARAAARQLLLADPLLGFDSLVFAKSAPASFTHMSDQYYGWWSRPGGGIFVLEGIRGEAPGLRCLTEGMPDGNFLRPELSYDAQRVLFAYARYYPETAGNPNKLDKGSIPEDAFYHLYEVGVDGTGLRRLTEGRYDDFDGRYLPGGEIVFLSTRRGTTTRVGWESAQASLLAALPDGFVRCGGDSNRPVSIYTLHVIEPDGGEMRAISPFESFEWTPSIAPDGRVLYARWDYVDRSNMPYISLWSTNPDGTDTRIVYGNFTPNPHCVFEARAIPGSSKLIFTASGHHSITGGSLVLLDTSRGVDGDAAMRRLTPEVCFPETEGWPATWFANPWPLSESLHLCAWSDKPLGAQGALNPVDGSGVYVYGPGGQLELLYRDPAVSSGCPIPLLPRERPHPLPAAPRREPDWARFALLDVYDGLSGVARGSVHSLRVVGVPIKVQPPPNTPNLGMTSDDPGKFVIGTTPVEPDGSAHFVAPAGVGLFFQALDANGVAIQTMRTAAAAQPGETLTCVGCHENRQKSPPNRLASAAMRAPTALTPGPEGSWPLRFDRLVQPVLEARCISCHSAGSPTDLTGEGAYERLVNYGSPSLRELVTTHYAAGRSVPGQGEASQSALWRLLSSDHAGVALDPPERERLLTWMDLYAQRQGFFSPEQEQRLVELREWWLSSVEGAAPRHVASK